MPPKGMLLSQPNPTKNSKNEKITDFLRITLISGYFRYNSQFLIFEEDLQLWDRLSETRGGAANGLKP